jgi:hypothetical protein
MDELAEQSPFLSVRHDQKVVAFGDDVVRYIIRGTVTVNGTSLVDQFFDKTTVCEHHCRCCAQFETVYTAILIRPFTISGKLSASA